MKIALAVVIAAISALFISAGLGVVFIGAIVGATKAGASAPSATSDIPPDLLAVYQHAAGTCPMQWQVLAAIGKIESDHGRSTAPGVRDGANSAGAQGPMQFMPRTWSAFSRDGDGDGRADVYDLADAIFGAAAYLCANGAGDPATVKAAIWDYNHDDAYVAHVLEVASQYEQVAAAGRYVLPIPLNALSPTSLTAPHHDYPAIDIPVPVGTPVMAATAGTVTTVSDDNCGWGVSLFGTDGYTYLYCHSSQILVRSGEAVIAGQQIMDSGGQPGAAGAGDATGPHLHFQISVNKQLVCPQSILQEWAAGNPVSPALEEQPTENWR